MLKLVRESIMRNQTYGHSLKICPHKILINYKGKESNFPVDKSDRHHHIQGVKVPISRNEMYQLHVAPGLMR